MAYDDATRVDEATSRVTTTDSVQSNLRAATKTFGEAVIGYMGTYGSPDQEKQMFRDKLIDLLRDMDNMLQ